MTTLQPYYSDRFLYSKAGLAGIIVFMHSLLNCEKTILDKYHYTLFYLSLSISPRMLFTVDIYFKTLAR